MRLCAPALAACLLVLSAVAAAARQGPPPGQATPAPARIVGRVIDPQTGAGRALARVELAGENRAVVADAEGRFVLEPVTRGPHRLVARLDGYEPSPARAVMIGDEPEVSVDLELGLSIVAEVRAPGPVTERATLPGAAVTLVDTRQIATQPGNIDDVFRVLQMAPGVAAADDNRNDLLVRGAGPIESEIHIDDFSLPNASHFAGQGGTAGGISLIAPWLIERASIQPGGFSAAYGERASSAVDLSLRTGSQARVSATGAAGVGGGFALIEGPLPGKRGSWLASVRKSFLEWVAGQVEDHLRPQYFDVLGKVDFALSARHRVGFLVLGGQDNVVEWSEVDRFETFHDNQRIGLAGLSLASRWSDRTSSRVAVSFGVNELSVVSRNRRSEDFTDDSREAELRVTGEATRSLGAAGALTAGVSLKRADLSFDLFEAAHRNEYNIAVPAVRSHKQDTFVDAGAYVEMTSPLGSRLRVRPGVRVDRSGSAGGVYGSPRVRGEIGIRPNVRVTGAWGIYRQGIPYIWIGSAPANAGLDPVRSQQVVAGVDAVLRNRTRVLVEGFGKWYSGYPVDPAEPPRVLISALASFESPFVGALVPSGRVRAMGLDAVLATGVGRSVTAGVNYSLWKVTQVGLDGVWRAADYDIRQQVRLNLAYTRAPWTATASWRYAGGRPYTPYDVAASTKARAGRFDLGRINGARYTPYHRLDVRGEREFHPGKVRLWVYAEVDNVYDRTNIYMYEWDNALKAPKPINQWGVTPIAGVRVVF